jgi:hypothetical protein
MRGIKLDENQERMRLSLFLRPRLQCVEKIKGSEISFRKFLKAQLHVQKREKSNSVSSREGKYCCTQESDVPGTSPGLATVLLDLLRSWILV